MKIRCLNCKAQFDLTQIGTVGVDNKDEDKALIRCPLCIDMLAYHPFKVPKTSDEKDDARYRHLMEYLAPRASLCGVQGEGRMKCHACPLAKDKRPNPGFCQVAEKCDALVSKWVERTWQDESEKPSAAVEEQDGPVDPSKPLTYDTTSMHGQDMWMGDDD